MFDNIASSLFLGLGIAFLNYVLVDEIWRCNEGYTIEKFRISYIIARVLMILGLLLMFGGPLLSVIDYFHELFFDVSQFLTTVMLSGMSLTGISMFATIYLMKIFADTDESSDNIGEKKPKNRKTENPFPDGNWRWTIAPNDESIPIEYRLSTLTDCLYRFDFAVERVEKMVKENNWSLKSTLSEEMDDLFLCFSQLEQRFSELKVKKDVNSWCRGYWIFLDYCQQDFTEQKQMFTGAKSRIQKKCLKKMKKDICEITQKIYDACEKSEILSYHTELQQQNLEAALHVLPDMTRDIKRLAIQRNDTELLEWVSLEWKEIEQCSILLNKRRDRLDRKNDSMTMNGE